MSADLNDALSEAITLLYTHGVITDGQRTAARRKLPTCKQPLQVGDWRPIKTAPFQTVIEVRNEQMDHPCLATRGYTYNGAVHPNTTFCTTVFTPDPDGLFPTPAGQLVWPTEWRPAAEQEAA